VDPQALREFDPAQFKKTPRDVVIGATVQNNARYVETYLYKPNANDRLDVTLLKIQTAAGFTQIENHYDAERRVDEQIPQQHGKLLFQYDPANYKTTFTDRRANKREFVVAASAFADGATAESVTEIPAIPVGAPKRTHKLRHNRDGLLVSYTDPAGVVAESVYDEQATDVRARGNLLELTAIRDPFDRRERRILELAVERDAQHGGVVVQLIEGGTPYPFPIDIFEPELALKPRNQRQRSGRDRSQSAGGRWQVPG
jgi:hypothetical protein